MYVDYTWLLREIYVWTHRLEYASGDADWSLEYSDMYYSYIGMQTSMNNMYK